jgi:hypothetical protein
MEYNRDFFVRKGREGVEKARKKYGPKAHSFIGKLGGRPKNKLSPVDTKAGGANLET